jgi:hypothetical protein
LGLIDLVPGNAKARIPSPILDITQLSGHRGSVCASCAGIRIRSLASSSASIKKVVIETRGMRAAQLASGSIVHKRAYMALSPLCVMGWPEIEAALGAEATGIGPCAILTLTAHKSI